MGDCAGQTCGKSHTQHRCFSHFDNAWRVEFGDEVECLHWAELLRSSVAIFDLDYDAILSAMYALSASAEGDCCHCVPPDPSIEAPALGASESSLPGTTHAEAFNTFTLDSDASRYFFVTAPPSLLSLHLSRLDWLTPPGAQSLPVPPLSSRVWQFRPAHCPVAPPCSCRLLTHQTLLWHHRLGHPSLPRLRGMHSHLLVSGLPRSLPPLPPSPAPPCLPCVVGLQRAAPHSSSFPPTTAPLQTLHMDVWGPARVSGQGHERYFLLVVDDYTRYTTVFPLRSKGQVVDVLIPWIRTVRLHLRKRFHVVLPVLHLCSDRGVMEVARTSMIHAAAPHFLWPFVVRYAAHQLNLWPHVSLPKTTPTPRWTRKVGNASVFRVWGSSAFVRNTSTDKLSACAIPGVFLGFPPDAPGRQFYHPSSRLLLPSRDATFDESVPFYCLLPYRSAHPPPHPLPPQGAASGDAAPRGAEPGDAESEGAGSGPGGAETESVEPGGAASEGAESGSAEPRGAASFGVTAGAGGTGGTAAASPGGARTRGLGAAGTGGVGGAGAGDPTEPRVAGAGGTGAGGAGAGGAGAVDPGGDVRPRPYYVPLLQQVLGVPYFTSLTPPLLCPPSDQSRLPLPPASPLPAPSPYTEQSGGLTERREPASCPVSPVRTARRVLHSRPPPVPARTLWHFVLPLFQYSTAASALVAELLDFAAACRLHYASPLVTKSASASPPSVGGECALGTDVLEDRQEDFECLVAAVPRFASMLLAPEGDPDALDIPTPRSYAEAITGPYSS
ncbi:unnamed protein product [Closterium sp. NIES-54]